MSAGVISTNPARCRDCYRCVRHCPVKAVRVTDGQAQVVPEFCLLCATCVRACPQAAKVVREDLPAVRAAMAAGRRVVATVAPSAPAHFDMTVFAQMERTLARLGFAAAGETAVGAEMVGQAHGEWVNETSEHWPVIASSCPVVVNLVEMYYPELIPHLAPIVSPMVAHGRYLRRQYGEDSFIVFIGPCIAKKGEMDDPMVAGVIDAALTYTELDAWMAEAGIDLEPAPAEYTSARPAFAASEHMAPAGDGYARLFPVEGGLVGTARMDTDILSSHVVTGTGITACQNVLEGVRSGLLEACLVELMACEGGCINGPALADERSVAVRRQRIMAYAAHRPLQPLPARDTWPDLGRGYRDRSVEIPTFAEEQIQDMLHRVDKYTPDDELNCGACGYDSCREKAVATLRGMAEATMCIPYMRSRAESLTNVVMDVAPNPIIIVDRNLKVQDLSPSAGRVFGVNRAAVRGRPLRSIIPVVDDFLAVRDTGEPIYNKLRHVRDGLTIEQTIVAVGGENLLVAILRDVTEQEQKREELDRLRAETLSRTQEVINKQMRVAHEIASLLGETTAETKVLLTHLAKLVEESKGGV
ncbi:MAG: PAS domain S-box protein [Chloroflexi bacterium]|nr:PAS domain S-box protein [Chloroflexota bacterium]